MWDFFRRGKGTALINMFLFVWDVSVNNKGDRFYGHVSFHGRKFSYGA